MKINIQNIVLTLFLPLFFIQNNIAQQTGFIQYDQLGIGFTVPNGWVGQEGQGMFVMGSHTEPGLVLLMPQDYPDLQTMQNNMLMGYADQAGTVLRPVGEVEKLSNNALGVIYQGTVEGQPAKGYLVGVLNPHGSEVAILSVTTTQQYAETQPSVAKAIMNSLQFSKPKTGPIVDKWKYDLGNTKLTYMESYYSGSYTPGGISGGYDIKKVFDLCSAGYFIHYGSNTMTAGGDFSSAYTGGRSQGSGTWDVIVNGNAQPVLQLTFNNGEVWEFGLEWREKKLYLNGERYFRTWTGDNKPSCQ